MAKINILPSKVYNRIAAGEVVDRPCSVVKELVENAIDAGATEIEIEIEKGGKELICVRDNGCGIEREDLPSAFLPHATSKIAKAEDLENILTLGFRGEAIASISAVSQMTITSQTEKGKCYRLSCNGGEMGEIVETTGVKGTEVRVELLFYHTPVRLGFLKTDKAEETEITNFVSRFILNHSNVAFTYYANGKKVLQSFGGGDEEAMVSVYGTATLSECFAIQAEKHGIRVRGYLGNQNFYKANKSYQSIFLNGRYIVNATISAAISNAYSGYLMKRQYPFYVLHIEMPTEIVDVNVHPNKSDVRFADNQIVYGSIYNIVSGVLDGHTKAMEYVVKLPQNDVYTQPEPEAPPKLDIQPVTPKEEPILPIQTPIMEKIPTEDKEVSLVKAEKQPVPPVEWVFTYEDAKEELEKSLPGFIAKKQGVQLPFEVLKKDEDEYKSEDDGLLAPNKLFYTKSIEQRRKGEEAFLRGYGELKRLEEEAKLAEKNKDAAVEEEDAFAANKRYLEELDRAKEQNRIEVSQCDYVGKLFNTYLLYQRVDEVYIIDQHAAHERLIFDKLKEQMRERRVIRQGLLLPYTIQLNAFESAFIRSQEETLKEMGFRLREKTEKHFEVWEIPLDLQNIDLNRFMHSILANINNYRAIKLEEVLKDKIASEACKAAVKGGMDLTREEVDALFALMDGDMGLKCPHGRPVVVKMTKKQLEKMFKRIV